MEAVYVCPFDGNTFNVAEGLRVSAATNDDELSGIECLHYCEADRLASTTIDELLVLQQIAVAATANATTSPAAAAAVSTNSKMSAQLKGKTFLLTAIAHANPSVCRYVIPAEFASDQSDASCAA